MGEESHWEELRDRDIIGEILEAKRKIESMPLYLPSDTKRKEERAMNTQSTDMEQAKYLREWVRKRAKKRMDRLEKKLKKEAERYYGEPVKINYVRPGVYMSIVSVSSNLRKE